MIRKKFNIELKNENVECLIKLCEKRNDLSAFNSNGIDDILSFINFDNPIDGYEFARSIKTRNSSRVISVSGKIVNLEVYTVEYIVYENNNIFNKTKLRLSPKLGTTIAMYIILAAAALKYIYNINTIYL